MAKMRFLQLSDTHIGRGDNFENIQVVVDGIVEKKDEHQCRVIVWTGDVVDDGHKWQYKQAKQIKDQLTQAGFEVIAAPGNHDYGPQGIFESNRAKSRFHKFLHHDDDYPRVDLIDGVAYITLDSMEKEMADVEFPGAEGELGVDQLTELDYTLGELHSNSNVKKIVVALHHHPFYFRQFLALRDGDKLKKVVGNNDEHGARIHALVFGHKHYLNRLAEKEKKYKIPIIYSSNKTTSVKKNSAGAAVYKISVIDLEANSCDILEINA